ncbi:putative methyltransferase tdiE [Colletotrichum trifolii]|uniref:Putative methyltransferase tdiE n=1 Tax=Colletotrichum trifolii TaxID=5466 RepID=A0A4R8RMD7_COLTR|nr:putative methyltransferase tdiE [Colletotrichum trifolii]
MARALKPGGWTEVQDIVFKFDSDDHSITSECTLRQQLHYVVKGLAKHGVDINMGSKLGDKIQTAGFVNSIHEIKQAPVGTWPSDPKLKGVGKYFRAVYCDSLDATANIAFVKGLGWTKVEAEVFLVQVRKDLLDDRFHTYPEYRAYLSQRSLGKGE